MINNLKKFLKKEGYKVEHNLVTFDVTDNITKSVTDFYDINPFPNYEIRETKQTILDKGDSNVFAKRLKKIIGNDKFFIEIGSGTSQLSNYLAIGNNSNFIAMDPTHTSLNLGAEFAKKNNINNITFLKADIFDDVLKDNIFDIVWCSGVLMCTKDPYLGFKTITKSLKKDGYIIIGLYNTFGRIRTIIRKYISWIFGEWTLNYTDPFIRNLRKNKKQNKDKIFSWIRDQYSHPIERVNTFDEILNWFDKNNIEYVNSIPSFLVGDENKYDYFEKTPRYSYIQRLISQIFMIFSNLGSEGGLFIMIGKKK